MEFSWNFRKGWSNKLVNFIKIISIEWSSENEYAVTIFENLKLIL